jgi:hypothetical protein
MARARYKVKASRLVGTLRAHSADFADVGGLQQPDSRQSHLVLLSEPVYDEVQDCLHRALLRHIELQSPNTFDVERAIE